MSHTHTHAHQETFNSNFPGMSLWVVVIGTDRIDIFTGAPMRFLRFARLFEDEKHAVMWGGAAHVAIPQ